MRGFILLTFLLTAIQIYGQQDSLNILSSEEAVKLALQNNYQLKNQLLETREAQQSHISAWNIEPLEFTYKTGNLYSTGHDQNIEINQNFGSLLEHIQNNRLALKKSELENSKLEILNREITAQVRSAYYFWIYWLQKAKILQEQKDYYSDLSRIAEMNYQKGEIDLITKINLIDRQAKINTNFDVARDECEIAHNKLSLLIGVDEDFIPESVELVIYQVNKPSDTSIYDNSLVASYYKNLEDLKAQEVKAKSAVFFPGINAGIINQRIGGIAGLWAWQIGFSLPLWFKPAQSQVQVAKIESEIAGNEYQYQLTKINKEIDNLMLELDKYFKQLLYYDNYGLEKSDELLRTSKLKFEKEEIEYPEFLDDIDNAIKIKLDYFEILNEYNQTAIQLEYYVH